ncbi:hypothetical protein [Acinetobacter sp.]|jgi:hypothetical protein|uniref:hypothetical protein n=1 Tax=Acinetobacter sp. TaxID=472 RepID=UPI0035B11C5B
MMQYAVKKYFKDSVHWLALCAGSLLAGCGKFSAPLDDPNSSASETVSAVNAKDAVASETQPAPSRNLAQAAGQVTLKAEQPQLNHQISEQAKAYAGRYQASIPCDDGFISCKQGTAELILNLLPDGKAHRSIIHYGKIFADRPVSADGSTAYSKDMWTLGETDHQIIVHREEGGNFYYMIQDRDHLMIEMDKTRNAGDGKNQERSKHSDPKPAKTYVLTRDKDEK